MNLSRRWLPATQLVSLFIIGVLAYMVLDAGQSGAGKYPLIAKRLFVENPNDIVVNFTDLRRQLQQYVEGSSEKIGLYFEYLPTGVSINVGGNEEFFRASLVKLPVVMRAYKYIEEGKLSLDDQVTLEEKQLDSEYGKLYTRGVGTTLTVRELINLILRDSDNTAFNMLYEKVNVQLAKDLPSGDQSADDVYDYLDIPRMAEGETPMITPKNYSSILKSLFFSAYLSYEHSNEILNTMSVGHEQVWLRQPIPESITVANKIGQYTVEPAALHVHSDCGIVYYPNKTYLLCVMVNSENVDPSVEHIRSVSKIVHNYIGAQ